VGRKVNPARRSPVAMQSAANSNDQPELPEGACPGCGRLEGPISGCDGTGRVVGGVGAVLSFWPIKAYKPCDEFLKAGKKYYRRGQGVDEVFFGAPPPPPPPPQ